MVVVVKMEGKSGTICAEWVWLLIIVAAKPVYVCHFEWNRYKGGKKDITSNSWDIFFFVNINCLQKMYSILIITFLKVFLNFSFRKPNHVSPINKLNMRFPPPSHLQQYHSLLKHVSALKWIKNLYPFIPKSHTSLNIPFTLPNQVSPLVYPSAACWSRPDLEKREPYKQQTTSASKVHFLLLYCTTLYVNLFALTWGFVLKRGKPLYGERKTG